MFYCYRFFFFIKKVNVNDLSEYPCPMSRAAFRTFDENDRDLVKWFTMTSLRRMRLFTFRPPHMNFTGWCLTSRDWNGRHSKACIYNNNNNKSIFVIEHIKCGGVTKQIECLRTRPVTRYADRASYYLFEVEPKPIYISLVSWNSPNANWLERAVIGRY